MQANRVDIFLRLIQQGGMLWYRSCWNVPNCWSISLTSWSKFNI